ncbi:sulfite exporter TauE/SafE family protein [Flavobacterium sediminis]|uniref:Probable membrane transporter protein n=1 Tax=Flavobacterium sediminis TaxID=2201181 RepID=A0A2U8QY05_9FLAO|nr:sulfite exporter TauE/SafE family protein [Flavobacterium sediminis]AWM15042.1 sulfite exporter TauE/SafE family protein [Flavobacterium sediminis]
MILKVIFLGLTTIIAFWLSAISGGGASLILIPVLNLFLPASTIPFTLTVGTLSSSASRIVFFKKHINWKIFFWFFPFSVPAAFLGASLMKSLNPDYLQFGISLFLIANVAQLIQSKDKLEKNSKKSNNSLLALIGFLAGFISGITGAIGLLFNRFYFKYGLSKEEIIATRAINEICLHITKLIIYISLGLFSKDAVWFGVTIALGAIASSYTVKFLLPFIKDSLYKRIGYTAMVCSGCILLISSSNRIIEQDHISVFTQTNETTINWRNKKIALEFSEKEGLEIEIPIDKEELPEEIKKEFHKFTEEYDKIIIEKIYKNYTTEYYEFNCYRENHLKRVAVLKG